MDAAMAQHYGALHSGAGYSSLHDEFLQDIHDTVWQRVSSSAAVCSCAQCPRCCIALIKAPQTSLSHSVLEYLETNLTLSDHSALRLPLPATIIYRLYLCRACMGLL